MRKKNRNDNNMAITVIILVLLLLVGFGWGFGHTGGMFFGPAFMILVLFLVVWLVMSLAQNK